MFAVCVAVPISFVTMSVISVSSINTFISSVVNVLVTSLIYSVAFTSVFVVPLKVMLIFGLSTSVVSISAVSFNHSVLYFGLMVPFVNSIVIVESVFSLKFVLFW